VPFCPLRDGGLPGLEGVTHDSGNSNASIDKHEGAESLGLGCLEPDSDGEEIEAEVTFKEEEEKPLDLNADFEEQLRQMLPTQGPTSMPAADNDLDNDLPADLWKTSLQLARFRQSAEKVASEYLKSQNVKLEKGRRRERTVRDKGAYLAGIEDSRNIDVKRRRIEGA